MSSQHFGAFSQRGCSGGADNSSITMTCKDRGVSDGAYERAFSSVRRCDIYDQSELAELLLK